jgi:hypothetical protein
MEVFMKLLKNILIGGLFAALVFLFTVIVSKLGVFLGIDFFLVLIVFIIFAGIGHIIREELL